MSTFRITDNRHKPAPEPEPAAIALFVLARLDEEQALAEAATEGTGSGTWRMREHEADYWMITDSTGETVVYDEGWPSDEQARHIAFQDPARTLTRIKAIRALAANHTRSDPRNGAIRCYDCADMCHSYSGLNCDSPDAAWPCEGIRGIAAIWADHPYYDPQWSVELH